MENNNAVWTSKAQDLECKIRNELEVWMKTLGLTQTQLAERLGINRSSMSRQLHNSTPGRRLDSIARIAYAMDLDVNVEFKMSIRKKD